MSFSSLRAARFVCFFLLVAGLMACSKKHKGNGDVKPQEQGLVLKLDGVSESTPTAAPGETYPFSVGVTSTLPAAGVTVTVVVTTVSGTDIPQPPMPAQTTAPISITLVNLPDLKTCNVTITITSVSNPENTVTKTFQITNKA
ncbi:hypothetical protein DCM91_17210 [Chitinophaga costaii]|nr:hypothetical protein [Chitinophaga costaii]PUZ21278.1 hypothetical protein DCM91_17210 [Chitinophaga costaii]